jgi:cytochrome c oxidase assembly factor 3
MLVVGVWAYSIAAVKQDSFADVDEEAKILAASGSTQNIKSIEDEEKAKAAGITPAHTRSTSTGATPAHPVIATPVVTPLPGLASRPKGILVPLLERYYPRLLDPTSKTLIWGAPPVDRIGRLRRD